MAIVGRHAETCLDSKLQKQRRTFLSGGCGWTTDQNFADFGSATSELIYDFLEDKTEEIPQVFLPKVNAPKFQLESSSCNGGVSGGPSSRPIPSDGAPTMLTCPNCLHAFGHPPPSSSPHIPPQSASCCHANHPACTSQSSPMLLSPSLRHPSAHTTCTVAVSRSSSAPAGGRCSVFITRDPDDEGDAPSESSDKFLPQPSPSVPLSFVLPMPAAPTLTTTAVPSSHPWSSTTTTTSSSANNPPTPFLAAIVPWTLPPTPSHEATSAWPWAASAVVVPAAFLVQQPHAVSLPAAPAPPPSPVAPAHGVPAPPAPSESPEADLDRLASTVRALRTSGWYYEGLSWQGSATVLADSAPGTFLVRDSSDPRFLFALSVQTERGPTSVRLHYSGGMFRLDAEPRLAAMMPLFDGVVRLVEHYLEEGKQRAKTGSRPSKPVGNHVWVDCRGRVCAHVMLSKPRYRSPPTLQHLARLAVNKKLSSSGRETRAAVSALRLPSPIVDYLVEYPHSL